MDLPAIRVPSRILAVAAVVAAVAGTGVASAGPLPVVASARLSAAPGESTAIPGFLIRSSAQTGDSGAVISTPGYNTSGWLPVSARSTVFAGLLENGRYPDPFFSTNMRNVPTSDFTVPWWYRADVTLGSETGLRTYLNLNGVMSKADVFVNGSQVANAAQVAGAYTAHELDVTSLTRAGVNSIAIRVYPNDPNRDLTMGWIDWLQTPPDKNMGIVRDVVLHRGGGVVLRDTHVVTALNAARDRADLTVKALVRNDTDGALSTVVAGTVAGQALSQTVSLSAHETKALAFPVTTVSNPQLWWPAGMGGQFLYDLDLTASVGGSPSDTARSRFGIREVRAVLDGSGHRRYSVNGRPLLIKGGGWSPDLFLRWNPRYVEDKLRAVLDLGLNTVRLEGHIEASEFFDLTDRLGILTMPGWECCDKWEGEVNGSEPGERWGAADFVTAKASMSAEAKRLRDHPSVISFLIGSDFAPNATQERNYLDALTAADWPNPVIPAAAARSTPVLGASGMKMNGPYDWIPPNYWYDKAHSDGGGAWGFATEISAGPDVPTMDTLRRMMTSGELNTLWQNFGAVQYHRSQSSTFNTLRIFDNALAGRYGAVSSLDDYVRKAQLAQYENVRAQFESYGRNFTDSSNPADGVIYWMLNSGWTSLHWQLFDYFLDQNGAYYGAKKAGEPLHVQYSYDNRNVIVVNSRHAPASGLTVKVDLFNVDGMNKFSQTVTGLGVPGDGGRATALTIPAVSGLSTTYLARLLLTDSSGAEVSRNVYWLSTKADLIDWANNDWFFAPTTAYADLKGLGSLAQATVSATASTTAAGDTTTTRVTLRNTSSGRQAALYLDAHVMASGAPVLPISWSDNAVSLWPGESTTLTATYRTADLRGNAPSVRIAGWNTPTQTIPGDGSTPPPAIRYEAENATISQGVVEANHLGFSGTGFVNYDNLVGSFTQFSVNAAAAGPATLTLRYSNGTTTNRPMDIAVNGTVVAAGFSFPSTGNWDTWASATIPVTLTAGTNTIRATATTANGGPNADYLDG